MTGGGICVNVIVDIGTERNPAKFKDRGSLCLINYTHFAAATAIAAAAAFET